MVFVYPKVAKSIIPSKEYAMNVFPQGQGTPCVIWIAYSWSLRIAYAITVVAYAEDMPLHASVEALRGLRRPEICLCQHPYGKAFT